MQKVKLYNYRILITGASGFLGGNLARYLLPTSTVIAQGNRYAPQIPECICVKCDLTNPQGVKRLIAEHTPTFVVHCAAMTSPDLCAKEPVKARQINTDATEYIVEYANAVDAPVLFLSTDLVFDGSKGSLYTESDTPNPVNLYGETKLAAEDIVLKGINANTVFRIALSYGIFMHGAHGGYLDLLLSAFDRNDKQRLYTDQYRTPLFSGDFCRAVVNLILAVINGCSEKKSRLYHICGAERMSRYEFGYMVASVHEKSHNLIIPSIMSANPTAQPRGADCALSCELARRELNFTPNSVKENLLYDKQIRKETKLP
ncbi:MAG: SDR family oxidoreductase [Candidatus Auribacterota bacterium]|jgi:dTDP-4-dehydrorhamnose reductase|nr:SDR family oxidoreductase [Candidatus Auribacterota bacterium]